MCGDGRAWRWTCVEVEVGVHGGGHAWGGCAWR